jgi:hypothetical protein
VEENVDDLLTTLNEEEEFAADADDFSIDDATKEKIIVAEELLDDLENIDGVLVHQPE